MVLCFLGHQPTEPTNVTISLIRDMMRPQVQVWTTSFLQKLAIRPRSQHKQCAQCVRHKAIIKRCAADVRARSCQMAEYAAHLRKQYSDRAQYWSERSQSRLRDAVPSGNRILSLIVDGLDHSKLVFPRTEYISSKEMAAFHRPHLDLQSCIAHGYGVFNLLTMPTVSKDSNLIADLLSWVMHCVCEEETRKGTAFDPRTTELFCQSDNTTRETKNNTTLRLLSTWVGGSFIKRAQYSCLMSGHSHEDIDQYFSICSSWIQDEKLLSGPEDFRLSLERMLRNSRVREHEPDRRVELISAVRNWILPMMRLRLLSSALNSLYDSFEVHYRSCIV